MASGRIAVESSPTVAIHETIESRTARFLTGQPIAVDEVIARVRAGLPAEALQCMGVNLRLSTQAPLFRVVGISPRTYDRRRKEKRPLDPGQSDRLYRLAKLDARAVEVFGDEATAADWLTGHNRVLGAAPIELLDTEAGADKVERVLTRIEHGVYS